MDENNLNSYSIKNSIKHVYYRPVSYGKTPPGFSINNWLVVETAMMTARTYDEEFKLACVNTSTWQWQLVHIYSYYHVSSPHVWINRTSTGSTESRYLEMIPMQHQAQHTYNICYIRATGIGVTPCRSMSESNKMNKYLPLLFYYAVWLLYKTIRCSLGGVHSDVLF